MHIREVHCSSKRPMNIIPQQYDTKFISLFKSVMTMHDNKQVISEAMLSSLAKKLSSITCIHSF